MKPNGHFARRSLVRHCALMLLACAPLLCGGFASGVRAQEARLAAELPIAFRAWDVWRAEDASLRQEARGGLQQGSYTQGQICHGMTPGFGQANPALTGLEATSLGYCQAIFAAPRGLVDANLVRRTGFSPQSGGPRPNDSSNNILVTQYGCLSPMARR